MVIILLILTFRVALDFVCCMHLNFRTKVVIIDSMESDEFFERSLRFWNKNRVWLLNESNDLFLKLTQDFYAESGRDTKRQLC